MTHQETHETGVLHPSKDITASYSSALEGKRVALGITGSVAAVKSVETARLLMRYGAEVYPVMSAEACRIIHPNLMHWATGNEAITELSGAIEHVALGGNVGNKVDLVLVCPSTANTIGKIASGIDDTTVTTLVTTAFGEGIPICIVPAMHAPMYRHPVLLSNIEKLEGLGVHFIRPALSEGKAKIPEPEEILWNSIRILTSEGPLSGKTVLVSAGRTVEYLDPIRVISNNSSGKMGMELVKALLLSGAKVHLVYGKGSVAPVPGVPTSCVDTAEDMRLEIERILGETKIDCMIAAAAVGDWKSSSFSEEKVSTHGIEKLSIDLVPTVKIIDRIKELHPELFLVAFRALHKKNLEELTQDAARRMEKAKADMIAVNDIANGDVGFESDHNEMRVFSRDGRDFHIPFSKKSKVAERLVEIISQLLNE